MNLGIVPSNREENGRVQEIAEVIRVVRVLPQIVGIDDQVFPEGLLKARVEFISLPGKDGSRRAEKRFGDGISNRAGEHQVFVEGGFHHAGVRNPQNRIRPFDVVCDSGPRFRLFVLLEMPR